MATYAYVRKALGKIAREHGVTPKEWKELRADLHEAYNQAVRGGREVRIIAIGGPGQVSCYDPVTEESALERNRVSDKYRVVMGCGVDNRGYSYGIPKARLTKLENDV